MISQGYGVLDKKKRLWDSLKVFLTSHMPEYLLELIRDNKDFRGAVVIKNSQKHAKLAKRVIFKGNSSLGTLFLV